MANTGTCENCGAPLRISGLRRVGRWVAAAAKGAVDIALGLITHDSPRMLDDATHRPTAIRCDRCGHDGYI